MHRHARSRLGLGIWLCVLSAALVVAAVSLAVASSALAGPALSGRALSGSARAGTRPILAGPWGPHQRGYGHVAPKTVDNGGDPTGVVGKIHWDGWGDAKTTGTGVGLWVGPHQIVADGTEESVKIVAFHLGTCHGRRAYNAIEWFFPQHGQRFSRGSYINPCNGRYYRHGRPI